MKQTLLILFVTSLFLSACEKATELTYDSQDNVYFDFTSSQRDSLLFTFAYEPSKAEDTVFLPVRISGNRVDRDRQFIVEALEDSSTAIPGKHYEPFKDSYTMPAQQGITYVPLIIYNTDPLLENQSVTLRFRLYPTQDLDTLLPKLIDGKLVFSSQLEQPSWWNMWLGSYYSRVKHQLFIITTGQIELTTDGLDAPKNLYFVSLLNSFLQDPFTWVDKHPEEGYVIKKRDDGNYDFYNVETPGKTILYRKNEQSGSYFFIDENGQEVI